jgi:hypothetical protein
MIYGDEHEALSKKISEALQGVCPALIVSGSGPREWHRCSCKVTGGSCTCVWHVMDRCKYGTWKHLEFAKEYNDARQDGMKEAARKVQQAMSNISGDNEKIESRTDILDIRDE